MRKTFLLLTLVCFSISTIVIVSLFVFFPRGLVKNIQKEEEENIGREKISNVYKAKLVEDIVESRGKGKQIFNLEESSPDETVVVETYKRYIDVKNLGWVLEKQGGLIIFNIKSQTLWQSKMPMADTPYKLEVRDINNDGVKEILSYWTVGDRHYKNLWIYRKVSEGFKLITPLSSNNKKVDMNSFDEFKEGQDYRAFNNDFGGQDIEVKDLDSDQVDEVKVVELDDYRQDSPNEAEYPHTKNTKIYKWNSIEFYLWQEETGGNTGVAE